jgi:hypothetical protein
MTFCRNPVLIVEGPGDEAAVPLMARLILHNNNIFDVVMSPRLKKNVEIRKLIRPGEFERYVDFCHREPADSIILAIDSDDFCPIESARLFANRIDKNRFRKPIAICFFNREYESMLLPSIEKIAVRYPDFRWINPICPTSIESIRDVKGHITDMMPKDRAYKETRDQARFTAAIDLHLTRNVSRSFRHFETSLLWLTQQTVNSGAVHPI